LQRGAATALVKDVIIDCDVGIDDALAIMLALGSKELRVRAITTVCGNAEVEKTSENALKVLETFDAGRIPVARGHARPLKRELYTAGYVHGSDGLGDSNLPRPKLRLDARHAVDLIIEEAEHGNLHLVCIGPLTNLASALVKAPHIVEKLEDVTIMGGAFGLTPYGFGNVTPVSEFNSYVDPEAAKLVFASGLDLMIVGLDVTTDPAATLTTDKYEKLVALPTRGAKFLKRISENLMKSWGSFSLHDPMALAHVVDPTLLVAREYPVDVETEGTITRGQTIADRRPWQEVIEMKGKARVAVSVDGPRFLRMFEERAIRNP
jgi:inosine-uridine nucleoside N-ribohydrolase